MSAKSDAGSFAGVSATLVGFVSLCMTGIGSAADTPPKLSGMWSDPPPSAIDQFCYFYCTDAGTDHLNKLLDDPANDARPYAALAREATQVQMQYIEARLTPAARSDKPKGELEDASFAKCEPYGLLRQLAALHQLEIKQYRNKVILHYGEWDARRTVYLNGTAPPAGEATLLGYSVGRYEGDELVVESGGARRNQTWWRTWHSDQATVVERYRKSTDGKRLELRATFTDPWGTTAAIEFKKAWGWAPEEKIYPYVNCETPEEDQQ